jgi:hypothetical protein
MEYLFAKNEPFNHAFIFNQKVGGDRSNLSLEFFFWTSQNHQAW